MLLLRFSILAEATNTLIKTFSFLFVLFLYYTFIIYDGRKSNKQQAERIEKRAENVQRAKSNEQ